MTRTAFALALHRLNTEISAALERGDQRTLQDIRGVASWVAHQWPRPRSDFGGGTVTWI